MRIRRAHLFLMRKFERLYLKPMIAGWNLNPPIGMWFEYEDLLLQFSRRRA